MSANVFQCANCKGTFEMGQSDEEALAEAERTWGTRDTTDMSLICDDCYQLLMAWLAAHPEENDTQAP